MSTLGNTSGASAARPVFLGERLLFLAVALSPFAQAFTIPIGFPLKLSELFGGLGVLLLALEGRKRSFRTAFGGAYVVLALIVVASAFANNGRSVPVPDHPAYSRGLTFDLVQYTVYGLVVLLVGWYLATRLGPERIGAAIGFAARLALPYCLIQLALWSFGQADILSAIQGVTQYGRSYGISIPRNGPFLEGNYLGFFAGAATFVSIRRGDRIGAACALACLIYSQSTSAAIALLGAFALTLLLRPRGKLMAVAAVGAAVLAIFVTVIPAGTSLLNVQLGKLGVVADSTAGQSLTTSRDNRAESSSVGFQMGLDNPLLGVGPGRFGVWNNFITDDSGLPINFVYGSIRPIANNGYAQIASELGLIALLTVVILLVSLALRFRRGDPSDFGLACFVLIGFSTSPSWTALPVWIAVSYMIGVAGKMRGDDRESEKESLLVSPSRGLTGSTIPPRAGVSPTR
jgi:O-antigen ligase